MPNMAPKSLQVGAMLGLQNRLGPAQDPSSCQHRCPGRFTSRFLGSQTPQDPHKTSPNHPKTSLGRPKDTPKTFLRPPKDPQRAPKDTPKRSKNDARSEDGRKTDFGPILDRFSIDFCSDLGRILDLLVSFTNGNIVYKPYQSVVPFKELKTDFGTILDRFSFDFCRILEGFWIDFG